MENETVLRVSGLRTEFRTDDGILTAVNGVSFDIAAGETLGIVGESGSGKSATCLSVMGLVPSPPGRVVSGSAIFDGRDLLNLPPEELRQLRGKEITMIFQDPMTSLNPFLRISTQLTEHLVLHERIPKKEALERAVEMLRRVGIPEPEKKILRYPHELSGGMRQRVMIAMALLPRPRLVFADEPTTALDVSVQAQILELLRERKAEMGLSLVLVTHNLGVVAGLADRVIVMYAGMIAEDAPVSLLFARPLHPYTRGLLDSLPDPEKPRGNELAGIAGTPPVPIALPDACPFAPRCFRAADVCRAKTPQLETRHDGTRVACWFPLDGGAV